MEAAALEILGDPLTRYTNELRYGNHGSLVINVSGPRAGQWKSWETNASGGVLAFLQHQLGLEPQEAWRWLHERHLVESRTPAQTASATPKPTPTTIPPRFSRQTSTTNQRDKQSLRNFARDLWSASGHIPTSSEHPARKWMAARHLWRLEFHLPSAVRWVPASVTLFRGLHQGAGSIAVLMAQPETWATAWPALPELDAIHLVSIDEVGQPALDRPADYTDRRDNLRGGIPKRSYGSVIGTVAILGNPVLEETSTPIRIIEGLADGIALAARCRGPIIASIGTPARLAKDTELVAWLATAPNGVVIHADADKPGQDAARALRRALQDAGAQVRAVLPPEKAGKDPADVARDLPFPPLSKSWADYASTLRDMYPAWPRREIARQADIVTGGGPDDQ